MPAKKPARSKKKPVRKPPAKVLQPRVAILSENELTAEQRNLLNSIRSGPRGGSTNIRGPFAVFLHAPAFGELAQRLGGHCRYKTAVPPRLSEFAILATARLWRAQYEWYAHVPQAQDAGVKAQTIRDLHSGRRPKSAPKDERAIYDFVQELYATRRVSDKTFKGVRDILGEAGTVELVGILGYYALISMILNVFRMSPPEGTPLPFPEK
ncbi:MAG: carboxymuconolactone decarboxylase family protein [Xanthobacteraceae bacterium]